MLTTKNAKCAGCGKIFIAVNSDYHSCQSRDIVHMEYFCKECRNTKVKCPHCGQVVQDGWGCLITPQEGDKLIEATTGIIEKINTKSNKDRSFYKIEYSKNGLVHVSPCISKRQIARLFAEIYLSLHPQTTFSELQKLFSPVKCHVITHQEDRYTLPIGNTGWYIKGNTWYAPYWEKLVKLIDSTGMKVSKCKSSEDEAENWENLISKCK